MMIYYVANHTNEYSSGVYAVVSAFLPHQNITQEQLEAQYDEVRSTDTLDSSIAGYPDKLVIDTTAVLDVEVREKNESEYTDDAKINKLSELQTYSYELITSVAPEDKQRSLTILYPNMTSEQQDDYNTYETWHANVLTTYFATKTSIDACTTRTELDAIVFDTEFSTEIAGKPDISLSTFI